jgi:hypothetical protein
MDLSQLAMLNLHHVQRNKHLRSVILTASGFAKEIASSSVNSPAIRLDLLWLQSQHVDEREVGGCRNEEAGKRCP